MNQKSQGFMETPSKWAGPHVSPQDMDTDEQVSEQEAMLPVCLTCDSSYMTVDHCASLLRGLPALRQEANELLTFLARSRRGSSETHGAKRAQNA